MKNKFSVTFSNIGWMSINIGNYCAPASYLKSTPIELLEAANSLLIDGFSSIIIDAEDLGDLLIVFETDKIRLYDYVIAKDGFSRIKCIAKTKIRYHKTAEIIFNIISTERDNVLRQFYAPTTEEESKELSTEIDYQINVLEKTLKIYGEPYKFEKGEHRLLFNYHRYNHWAYRRLVGFCHWLHFKNRKKK